MAYVAVKGGERAIDAAHAWLASDRRGDPAVPLLQTQQVEQQLGRAVDRVMAEGSLMDHGLAALAVRQAQGDLIEAAFLLRAYRTTLPRFLHSEPLDTGAMRVTRRVSAIFKDLPGGQVLGPTYDYTHRLLDFMAAAEVPPPAEAPADGAPVPPAFAILGQEGLVEPDAPAPGAPGPGAPGPGAAPFDLTRTPMGFPAGRDARLQALARGDEGFLLALGYSTQRGYGNAHPFVGELRVGEASVCVTPPELGFTLDIGDAVLTECQMVNQFHGSRTVPPVFTRGYGLCFGHGERRAMGMALVDRAMRAGELGEHVSAPAQDVEFVLSHCDTIEATGFVEHLKLPHHVDFQSELETIRRMRAEAGAAPDAARQEAAE